MNIKIVLCFIMLCLLPVASAGATNYVWAARSSEFIKPNGSVSFENYIIRATPIDDTKASVTVYRGQSRIETGDFNINEFKTYDKIGVTLLGIRGDFSWISISKFESKDFWRPLARTLLKWDEKYTIDNYTFSFDTFGSDSVNMTVSNKSMAETNMFSTDGLKDYETLRMVVRNINRTGFIDLEFFTNKPPAYKTEVFPFIKAEMLTDKYEYFPDETIQVSIKTSSDFPLNIAGIFVETDNPAEILPDNLSATDVTGTQYFQSKITGQPENSTVTISAKIDVRDYSNNSHVINVSKKVLITPEVAIIKSVQEDTDDEHVSVHLYVHNSASENMSIHIHDEIPDELTKKVLDWDVELIPGNTTIIEYNITPEKPGLYFLPPAKAEWNGKSTVSRRVKMTMHMPYISMTKTAVYGGNLTHVKIITSNIGDRPAQVNVSDKLPAGSSAVEGDTAWSGKLESGEIATISYSLQGNIDVLPAANATYRDIRGVTRQSQSNIVDPKMGEPSKKAQPTVPDKKAMAISLNLQPQEIISFMIASFLLIAGIITGPALLAYLITIVRR